MTTTTVPPPSPAPGPGPRPAQPPSSSPSGRRRPGVRLSATWPIWVVGPGILAFWALGFGFLTRTAIILPVALKLLMLPRVRIPPRFGFWLALVAWHLVTSVQLDSLSLTFSLLMNGSEYVAITLCFLLVYNLPGDDDWLRRVLLGSYLVLVFLGLLATIWPEGALPSIASAVVPRALLANEYVGDITTPALAQVQDFLGFALPRPSGPYTYANGWGSSFALLLPFALASAVRGTGRERWLARAGLVLGLVPAVLSLNRAMWGSMVVALVFLVLTTREPVLRRSLGRAAVASVLVLVVASFSPLGNVVMSRLDTPHSNNARSDLAVQTLERVLERPIIGYGEPIPYEGVGIRPPVGTQGQLWYMVIANGIPMVVFFLAYFVRVWPTLRGPRWGPWTRTAILVIFVQLPFYGMLGGQLILPMMAIAAAQREVGGVPRRMTRVLPAAAPPISREVTGGPG